MPELEINYLLFTVRSPKQDSEKKIVLCKKGDDITRLDGKLTILLVSIQYIS
jgi:hypothetical protein